MEFRLWLARPGRAAPATGASVTTNGLTGQLVVSWKNGANSDGALVVMRPGLPVTAQPVDGQTINASTTFGSGDNLGDDEFGAGNYAVFNGPTSGTTSSVTVSNLVPTTTYYAAVYSTKGSGASTDYTIASPGTGSAVAAGGPTNISLVLPSTIVVGSARRFSVLANYDNGTTSDITACSERYLKQQRHYFNSRGGTAWRAEHRHGRPQGDLPNLHEYPGCDCWKHGDDLPVQLR